MVLSRRLEEYISETEYALKALKHIFFTEDRKNPAEAGPFRFILR